MSSAKTIRDLNQIYLNEVSADTALSASKAADKKRGQLAAAGDKEGAAAKAQQASRLYKASAEKRKKEPAKKPDRSYPMGRGASYRQEDKDWGYDKDGNSLNPVDIEKKKKKDDDLAGAPNVKGGAAGTGPVKANFGAEDIAKAHHKEPMPKLKKNPVKEDYETKKKEEVLSAMKRQGRKLSDKDKDKIANKVVASKGDTSKSDDRYAYEELNQVRKLVEKVSTVNEAKKKPSVHDDYYDPMEDPEFDPHEAEATRGQSGRGTAGKMNVRKKYPVKEGMEHNLSILSMIAEKEVKVKDTKKVVDAIRAYDKSKDASRDATYDTDEGDKEKADIEKKYAAKERGEIDKDDPNWKKRKYHTGIHGEEVEALKRLVESGKFSDEEIEVMAWDVYEGYQRNPEEGERKEREANKKYEKVRGERTPMPPRGNKRREEFERWYAANVR